MVSRRQFIKSTAVAALAFSAPGIVLAESRKPANRFLLVILRGGMDGLAAIPAIGDKAYRDKRGSLALPEPGSAAGALDLDGYFGLHPRLTALHELYRNGEFLPIQGTAPPYDKRSHFDAQNVLETGISPPHSVHDGWLYRSLAGVGPKREVEHLALALGTSVPLVLQGAHPVGSWAPDNLPEPNDDTLSRVMALYSHDAQLGPALASMMETDRMMGGMKGARRGGPDQLGILAKSAATALANPNGPQIAVLDAGGWDTHANEGSATGLLANRLAQLDAGVTQIKQGLGDAWSRTVILAVTEFGRTVAVNGTRGTDHGVGGAAFMLGGAVAGGHVLAHWQGMDTRNLYQGRDIPPAIDQRSLFKSVLVDHLGVDAGFVSDVVFPGSQAAAPIRGLLRKTGRA